MWHLKGRSPVCEFMCVFKVEGRSKLFGQSVQGYFLSESKCLVDDESSEDELESDECLSTMDGREELLSEDV